MKDYEPNSSQIVYQGFMGFCIGFALACFLVYADVSEAVAFAVGGPIMLAGVVHGIRGL